MYAPVLAMSEYVLAPAATDENELVATGERMLRAVAVSNQEAGRREFTSVQVACVLGGIPEQLGLWTRLDLDHILGVALTATLAKQTDKAPAQYQFKHLSFQEGLYAKHLLDIVSHGLKGMNVSSTADRSVSPDVPPPPLSPKSAATTQDKAAAPADAKNSEPSRSGWVGWRTDQSAAAFLNNRYMANTCRIASGHLGSLLAQQRGRWDFSAAPLDPIGRQSLWYICLDNSHVEEILVPQVMLSRT